MKTFKILSFDGGGVKGALSVGILKRICRRYPNFLNEVDLFAGTSTGSIIALALANNMSVEYLDNLYSYTVTKEIFSPSRFNLFRPKFSNKNLHNILTENFTDELTLKDLNKYVFIPTFSINGFSKDSWEPVFINNLTTNPTIDFKVVDIALASSAAPTFFPSYKNFIDGGVVANSPTASAVFSSINSISYINYSSQIKLLSIGTGDSPDKITGKTDNWGIAQWSFHPFAKMRSPFLSLVMDGMCNLEDMYCREFLKDNYFRINPKVSKFIEMDNYKLVPYLKEIAKNVDLNLLYEFIEEKFIN
ncbi:patatin-like phospholipase family protein [Clostridium carnis]